MNRTTVQLRAPGITLIIMCLVLTPLVFAGCGKGKTPELPPTVEVVAVARRDVPVYSEWVGTLDGAVNATIRAQVQGYLVKQLYQEGDVVKKGQVLFEIDPRTFQAAHDEARGQVAFNAAKLDQARSTLARVKPLTEQRALSQKDLDDAVAAEKSARASLDMARAELEKARLNLEFTRITSPIDGIAGIAKAQIGNLVSPQSTEELTTVSQVDPIKVIISISEQQYLAAVKNLQGQGREAQLELILSDGSVHPHAGVFSAADRQVDVKTGTLKMEARFPNPGNVLRPGQFAKVRAMLTLRKDALLVPERCLTELQGQQQVAVVGPDNTVDIRTVRTGQKTDGQVIVEEGLRAGENVVVEGTQRLKQGGTVVVKPYAEPAAPDVGPPGETGKE